MFPAGFISDPLLEGLLNLYLGTYPSGIPRVGWADKPARNSERWNAVLVGEGLAHEKDGTVSLTVKGEALIEQALSQLRAF